MTTASNAELESTSAAQRFIAAAETAAKEATDAAKQFADTLPSGYANGIVPHRATRMAKQAADMSRMSADIMRRAMEIAEAGDTEQRNT